jgi:hypothetical protein
LGTTYLHLDIEYADPSLLCNVAHRLDARAVVVVSKLRMLDEALVVDQLKELLLLDKVVLATILLSTARASRGVRDAEAKLVGILLKQALEDSGLAGAAGTADNNRAVPLHGGGIGGLGIGGRHLAEVVGEGACGDVRVVRGREAFGAGYLGATRSLGSLQNRGQAS